MLMKFLIFFNQQKMATMNLLKYGVSILLVLSFLTPGISQTKEQKTKILEHTDVRALESIAQKQAAEAKRQKEEALQMAKLRGWEEKISQKGTFSELQRLNLRGEPVSYTHLTLPTKRIV